MSLIYLIGGRASGKTAIGNALAADHGYAFADLDVELCRDTGKTVAEIVEEGGWDGFRSIETQILQKYTDKMREHGQPAVLACGGGVIERSENIDLMRENGLVIWLDLDIDEQVSRLAADPLAERRPSLTGSDAVAEIAGIMERRAPLYARAAHAKVNAGQSVGDVCVEVVRLHGQKMQNRH